MDAVWPRAQTDLDVSHAVFHEGRIHPDDSLWVTMLMVSSVDGAAAISGVSGGLGSAADKAVFGAFRSMADVIVVGGGTAVAESYGPVPRRDAAAQERRRACGQPDRPRLAIVSASLPFAPDDRLFSDPEEPPLIYTATSAPESTRDKLSTVAEFVTLGDSHVDVAAMLADLHERGHRKVLLEGGPTLNGALMALGLVDEIHLSMAPVVVGGSAPRIVGGPEPSSPRAFTLSRLWSGDGMVFLRYLSTSP